MFLVLLSVITNSISIEKNALLVEAEFERDRS
jgi:hypothetical protein